MDLHVRSLQQHQFNAQMGSIEILILVVLVAHQASLVKIECQLRQCSRVIIRQQVSSKPICGHRGTAASDSTQLRHVQRDSSLMMETSNAMNVQLG